MPTLKSNWKMVKVIKTDMNWETGKSYSGYHYAVQLKNSTLFQYCVQERFLFLALPKNQTTHWTQITIFSHKNVFISSMLQYCLLLLKEINQASKFWVLVNRCTAVAPNHKGRNSCFNSRKSCPFDQCTVVVLCKLAYEGVWLVTNNERENKYHQCERKQTQ